MNEKIKIQNRINIIPITLFIIWCFYILYYFLFRIKSFANEIPYGASYLMIELPILALIFTVFTLLIIANIK